jgi:hypothetical protein
MASRPQIDRASCTSSSIASAAVGDLFVQPVTGFDAIFRSELTEGTGTRRALQPSALSECRKINPGWGIPSTRAIAGAKLQSDILVAIRKAYRKQRSFRHFELEEFRSGYSPSFNHTYIAERLFCGFLGDPRLGRVRPWSAAELASAQLMLASCGASTGYPRIGRGD